MTINDQTHHNTDKLHNINGNLEKHTSTFCTVQNSVKLYSLSTETILVSYCTTALAKPFTYGRPCQDAAIQSLQQSAK